MPTRAERIEGGLLGLLIGDALGVPYEFHRPESIPPLNDIDFEPPSGFQRAHLRVPPGTWSDDGAQALCLLASLLDCDCLDTEDLARRFVRWHREGYMAVNGIVFDVGSTTLDALYALQTGSPALEAGPKHEFANGNGSLMRVLPLALWHRGDDAELVADAHAQSRVTHGHMRSQVCCALYCLWARRILAEAPDPWSEAVAALRSVYQGADNFAALNELELKVRPDEPAQGRGTGYVLDCLLSARLVLLEPCYEAVVKKAVALGHDTDTTACVAGGLAGLRDGVGTIRPRWRAFLRGEDLYRPLLQQLLARG
jgi:ADP-ribosylglycohydrolase